MAVLLLRLAGPMQSWGTQSRFTHRDTDLEPSKSGVIGLLCAAMGKPRDDLTAIKELAGLKMGVRVDRQGTLKCDYHTAQNVAKAGGGIKDCELSNRFYLTDACFLVALQGDLHVLKEVDNSLRNPVWQMYLGRKAFVPGLPVYLPNGLLPDCVNLLTALNNYPYLLPNRKREMQASLRIEFETEFGQGDMVKHDQPISFISADRQFGLRYVKNVMVERAKLPLAKEEPCIYLA
ncbi:MAG: type I-E CRISPR-associated protein Cas5/CasD [Dehalococcoidales bacterium]|nr:type I-E CRISPR-associated protein Cas5/CasD [Dehalococcoidales bacterium]